MRHTAFRGDVMSLHVGAFVYFGHMSSFIFKNQIVQSGMSSQNPHTSIACSGDLLTPPEGHMEQSEK